MRHYAMHIGDYAAATAHLSDAEDLAYRRLLDAYYAREAPLPTDEAACCRLARATSATARRAVGTVLREFFALSADGWRQKRCDLELARQQAKSAGARDAINLRWARERQARAAAEQQAQEERDSNVIRTYADRDTNELPPTTHDPRTTTSLPTVGKKTKGTVAAAPLPDWLPADAWDDFAKARQAMKAKLTPKAASLLIDTLAKLMQQGHDPRAVIEQSIARGWRGLFPVKPSDTARAPTRQQTRVTTAAAIFGTDHDRPDDRTIDGKAERIA